LNGTIDLLLSILADPVLHLILVAAALAAISLLPGPGVPP
jgi:hypothetical protein